MFLRREVMDVNIPPAFVLGYQEGFECRLAHLGCKYFRVQRGSEVADDFWVTCGEPLPEGHQGSTGNLAPHKLANC